MDFRPADTAPAVLRDLLLPYYREGEDADTPQAELEDFISYLLGLLEQKILRGVIAYLNGRPAGFVLYAPDDAAYPFSEMPGLGTIAEIGVLPKARHAGLGQQLVRYAENDLLSQGMYVCAYPDAHAFWQKCGYRPTGETAGNGLPIWPKCI